MSGVKTNISNSSSRIFLQILTILEQKEGTAAGLSTSATNQTVVQMKKPC